MNTAVSAAVMPSKECALNSETYYVKSTVLVMRKIVHKHF